MSDISTCAGAPASSDRTAPGEASASTPMIRTPGFLALAAVATPEIIPPPPTGTTIVVTSGTCSRLSRAMVPWPAITARSSKACTSASCSSAASRSTSAMPSESVSPVWMTRAPLARVLPTLISGALLGMTIVHGTRNREAWRASAWAWLPALAAITPVSRCA